MRHIGPLMARRALIDGIRLLTPEGRNGNHLHVRLR